MTEEAENKAKKEQILGDALQYFQQTPGFTRLFEGFKEKYASLGYVGGNVPLNNVKEAEKNALSGFLGKDLSKRKTVSVSAETFQKALSSSRFEGISVEELVYAYFDGGLVYKKHTREQETLAQQDFFQRLISTAKADGKTILWVQGILREKHAPYNQIIQEYHENQEALFKRLSHVMRGISLLTGGEREIKETTMVEADRPIQTNLVAMRLPVFAAHVTGEPHYFDKGAKAYTYLLHGIYYRIYGEYMGNSALNAEGEAELFYRAGLMKDDLSNFVMCFGIRGYLKPVVDSEWGTVGESSALGSAIGHSTDMDKGKNGRCGFALPRGNILHEGLEAFFQLGEPVMLSLRNLNKLAGAYAVEDKVFVVENPAVFGAVIGDDGGSQISAVCSAGQPNLAVLVLLDMLAASGAELYYSGDFDPEGLLIADRLKLRYGEQLKLWYYTKGDYEKALSEKGISDRRLRQLDKLQNEELREIGAVMKEIKRAGYQEGLLEGMDNWMWERYKIDDFE